MNTAYLGIGSNLGDRARYIKEALEKLGNTKGIKASRISSIYETEPEGGPLGQGKYLNGVVEIKTSLSPEELLFECKNIEKDLGRKKILKDGPREIDLDVLLYDDLILNEADLVIPHPRMHKRAFALKGLVELVPDKIHPVLGESVMKIYEDLEKVSR